MTIPSVKSVTPNQEISGSRGSGRPQTMWVSNRHHVLQPQGFQERDETRRILCSSALASLSAATRRGGVLGRQILHVCSFLRPLHELLSHGSVPTPGVSAEVSFPSLRKAGCRAISQATPAEGTPAPPVPSPHVSSLRRLAGSFLVLLFVCSRTGSFQTGLGHAVVAHRCFIQSRFIARPHCVPRPRSHHSELLCAHQMGEKEESLPALARN